MKKVILAIAISIFLVYLPDPINAQSCECRFNEITYECASTGNPTNPLEVYCKQNITNNKLYSGNIAPGDPTTCETPTYTETCSLNSTSTGCTINSFTPIRMCTINPCNNNGTCESGIGENTSNCPSDCTVSPPPPGPTCSDGIQNGTETGVDCGGSCPACTGNIVCNWCTSNAECSAVGGTYTASTYCSSGTGCCYTDPPPSGPTYGSCWMSFNGSAYNVPMGQTVDIPLTTNFYNTWSYLPGAGQYGCYDPSGNTYPTYGDAVYPIRTSDSTIARVTLPSVVNNCPTCDGNTYNMFCELGGTTSSGTRTVRVSGLALGSVNLTARGMAQSQIDGVCYANTRINVTPPLPWWQVRNGNVMVGSGSTTTARLASQIPATCTLLNGCNPNFIIDDPDSNTPSGVAVAPGASSFRAGSSTAKVNTKDWLARTQLNGDASSAEFYFNLAESKVVYEITDTVLDITDIDTAKANWVDEEDVVWLKQTGDDLDIRNLTIAGTPADPYKVVVLIECGSLNVGEVPPGVGRLQVNEPNSDFIFIVVGKCSDNTKGKVTVKERVKELDGVIIADGDVEVLSEANCSAGVDDRNQLNFRGNLIAKGRVILNRNFCQKENNGDDGNETQPTETFENLEEWDLFFPSSLSEKHIYWREIVP